MGNDTSHPFHGGKKAMSEAIKKRMQIIEESNAVMHDNYHPDDEKAEGDYRNKQYGCLMGALIGDASGVLCKGAFKISKHQADFSMSMPEKEGPFFFAPGQVSVNGEMSMALFQAWLEMEKNKFEPLILAKWYDYLAKSGSPTALHTGNKTALKIIADWEGKEVRDLLKEIQAKVQQFNSKNQSNGAIKRAPFIAVLTSNVENFDHVEKTTRFECGFTHCHKNALNAQVIMVMALRKLIKKIPPISVHDQLMDYAKEKKMGDVVNWLDLAKKFGDEIDLAEMDPTENSAWVKYPFVLSMMFMLRKNITYSQAIQEVLMVGGDTCINAMMVGAVMGARLGHDHLPTEPVDNILNCDMAKYKGGPPRPEKLQPAKVFDNLFTKWYERKENDIEVDTRLRPDHHFETNCQSQLAAKKEEKEGEAAVIDAEEKEEKENQSANQLEPAEPLSPIVAEND